MSASREPMDPIFNLAQRHAERAESLRAPIFADGAMDSELDNVSLSDMRVGAARRGLSGMLGVSAAMQPVYRCIVKVAPTDAPVLIIGESGVGKELVARIIHQRSPRGAQPFIAVSCGALAENPETDEIRSVLEDAFTGREGFFEQAGSGTLLLDDITQLPTEMQIKLLRALEEGESSLQCRVIATTQCDPDQAVREGRLRADLFYRLAAFPIRVPALRDREGDAAMLARHFLEELNAEQGTDKRFSGESLACIGRHSWPGNVRELRNAVQCAFILADELLDLTSAIVKATPAVAAGDPNAVRIPIGTALSDVERCMIVATLKRCGGNKTRAAAVLGVSLKTLYNRLNEYRAAGLVDDKFARLAGIVA